MTGFTSSPSRALSATGLVSDREQLTVCFWARCTASSGTPIAVSYGTASLFDELMIGVDVSAGQWRFYENAFNTTDIVAYTNGQWRFFAFTRVGEESPTNYTLYTTASLTTPLASKSSAGTFVPTAGTIVVGNDLTAAYGFPGEVVGLKLWMSTVLTEQQLWNEAMQLWPEIEANNFYTLLGNDTHEWVDKGKDREDLSTIASGPNAGEQPPIPYLTSDWDSDINKMSDVQFATGSAVPEFESSGSADTAKIQVETAQVDGGSGADYNQDATIRIYAVAFSTSGDASTDCDATVVHGVNGQSDPGSDTDASTARGRTASGQADPSSSADSATARGRVVSGLAEPGSSTAAAVGQFQSISGQSDPGSDTINTLTTRGRVVTALAAGLSSLLLTIGQGWAATGSADGGSSATANAELLGYQETNAQADGSSDAAGAPNVVWNGAGTADGQSSGTATAELLGYQETNAQADGGADTEALVTVLWEGRGVADGASSTKLQTVSIEELTIEEEIMLQKQRIHNELINVGRGGTFYACSIDKETQLMEIDESVVIQPDKVTVFETVSFWKSAENYKRHLADERKGWTWVLRLHFAERIAAEVFEDALSARTITLSPQKQTTLGSKAGDLRGVIVRLVSSEYTEPPEQGSSRGSWVDMTFEATLRR